MKIAFIVGHCMWHIFLSVTINDSFSVSHSRVHPFKLNQKVRLKIKVARAIVQSLELGNLDRKHASLIIIPTEKPTQ